MGSNHLEFTYPKSIELEKALTRHTEALMNPTTRRLLRARCQMLGNSKVSTHHQTPVVQFKFAE